MASSSAAISSEGLMKKYDVFISFRGEDTRKNFISHLHAALCRRKLETYIDNRLDKGDKILAALLKAIEESYASLIVFSENYASSKWCLNELTKIIECKKLGGHIVIPVFYQIDPSHVRKQLGSYKNAFIKHERDLKHDKDRVLNWKTILNEAANLDGFDSQNYRNDHELVEEIAKDVQKKVNNLYPPLEFEGLVGFHQNFRHMETLLAINTNKVRIIGIWGMGGVGKTTLAAALFTKYSRHYEGRCFLESVRTESKKHGLNTLRNRLVSELLEEDNHEICTPGMASSFVTRRLRSKKVFIVLDDINTLEQLACLVGKHDCLGHGSRVILTTRDKHVLSKGIDGYHEVKKLNFEESLQLFSLNAFNKSKPKMRYKELSIRAVNYAKGVPLALKVLGSFLHSKSEKEWESALRKLKKIPKNEIHSVLRLSYEELDDEEKEIFLDIACFLKGCKKNIVKKILNNCGFFADIGIRNLIDKALIKISYFKTIEMHDLIQEMGLEIVRQEFNRDFGKCRRLWDPKQVYHVLKNNKGFDAIEGIILDAYEFGDLYLESDVFMKMINLRYLIFNVHWNEKFNLYIPLDIESFPDNLCYLHWSKYPLKSLPSTFHPEKLVVLHMPNSQVEKLWDGIQNLANLEEIILVNSQNLLELPDFSRAINLKIMYLGHCTSLLDVHPSILSLPQLDKLYVDGCTALKRLKSNVHSTSLSWLSAKGCSSLEEFSVTSENMISLDLSFTAIDELPPSILLQKKLTFFTFRVSDSLNKLPEIVDCLDLSDCCSQGNFFTLHIIMGSLWFLKELVLNRCTLSELPDNIDQLASLLLLSVEESHLMRLPKNIKHLPQLKILSLFKCEKLQSLPELPMSISFLDASNCISLEILFGSGEPCMEFHIAVFSFENCIKLGQQALDTIMTDAYVRVKVAANGILSTVAKEQEQVQEEGNSDDEENDANFFGQEDANICFCFPGNKLPDWFNYCSIQPFLTIEIPSYSKILGFAFCVIIPKVESNAMNNILNLGCKWSFLGDNGERITNYEWFNNCSRSHNLANEVKLDSDHVYIWYDARNFHRMKGAIEHKRTGYNMKFSFTFLVETTDASRTLMEHYLFRNEKQDIKTATMIGSCGVQPIYVSEDPLSMGDERNIKSNKSMENYELESLPKITRKVIFPAISSGNWKQNKSRGLKDIFFSDC